MLIDLDTLSSSIAFAWFLNTIKKIPAVSLVQTPRSDLHLRPENLSALELAGFDSTENALLCSDDIPPSTPFPSTKFALVDHNHILDKYTKDNPEATVVAIIDHHDDEGFHKDTANPRIVKVPIGSCSSLVAEYIRTNSTVPPSKDLSILLMCSLLIDTDGLAPGGKAEDDDRDAAAFLLPFSDLSSASAKPADVYEVPEVQQLAKKLSDTKADVSTLGTRDLLRRDYKEYTVSPQISPDKPILVGLATVPIGLKPCIKRDKDFLSSAAGYMGERQLTVLGILTSFHDNNVTKKHPDGKHRREQMYFVRKGVVEGLGKTLFHGLEASQALDLQKRDLEDDYNLKKKSVPEELKVKVWEQGKVHASRKVTAPLVMSIIDGKPE